MTIRLGIRGKTIAGIVLMVAYLLTMGAVLRAERQKLQNLTVELEQEWAAETGLDKVSWTLAHAIIRLQTMLYIGKVDSAGAEDAALDFELVQSGLDVLARNSPRVRLKLEGISFDLRSLINNPTAKDALALREAAQRLDAEVQAVRNEVEARRAHLRHAYQVGNARITTVAMSAVVVGSLLFLVVVTFFLNRVVRDIRSVEERAVDIVSGYQGPALEVSRRDEIGALMIAVNGMQVALRDRDQKLELAREEQFHREKMAAIGSLASVVAHEINNPIAAIAGIARSMKATPDAETPVDKDEGLGPQAILDNIQRISAISRQISELATPASTDPGLVDVNQVVSRTCKFARYDNRFKGVEFVLDTGQEVPAAYAVADHLSQVVLNLLLNSADAFEGVVDRARKICLTTRARDEEVVIEVQDNGRGMDETVMAHVFEQFFSTKDAKTGRGIGLFLCKTLIEQNGGSIKLESTLGSGTTATISLPTKPPMA